MRIIFVRHGQPNYEKDCLTELGHKQAEAAAERLKDEGICEVHASSCGRAVETAQHTADKLGLEVITHDFMREITWGASDGGELPHRGHPWHTADEMVRGGMDLQCADWSTREPFSRNIVPGHVARVAEGFDQWMQAMGYTREGQYYRVTGENTARTVAMFSHGGAGTAALARLFNMPFPYACEIIQIHFTSITVVELWNEPGTLVCPQFELMGDCRHIEKGELEVYFS